MKSIEQTCHDVTFGYDEPNVMYCLGATILEMDAQLGRAPSKDSEGRAIVDSEMYEMTREGIFRLS